MAAIMLIAMGFGGAINDMKQEARAEAAQVLRQEVMRERFLKELRQMESSKFTSDKDKDWLREEIARIEEMDIKDFKVD